MSTATYKPRSPISSQCKKSVKAADQNQPPKKGVAYKVKPKKRTDSDDSEASLSAAGSFPPVSGAGSDDDDDDMPIVASKASLVNSSRRKRTLRPVQQPAPEVKQSRKSSAEPRSRPQKSRKPTSPIKYKPDPPSREDMCRSMRQGVRAGLRHYTDSEKHDFCAAHLPSGIGKVSTKTSPYQVDVYIQSWWNRVGKRLSYKLKSRASESVSSGSGASSPPGPTMMGQGKKQTMETRAPSAASPSMSVARPKASKKRKTADADQEDMVENGKKKARVSPSPAVLNKKMVAQKIPTGPTANKALSPSAAATDANKAHHKPSNMKAEATQSIPRRQARADTPRQGPMPGHLAIALPEAENKKAREAAEHQAWLVKQVKVDREITQRLTEPGQVPKVSVPGFGGDGVLASLAIVKK